MVRMFRQILFEMRYHKMMTWVSVSGVALSIFLVMAFYMVEQLPTVEVAPESNRSRMLYGGGLYIIGDGHSQSGCMSYKLAERMHSNLDGIGKVAYSSVWNDSYSVGLKGKLSYPMSGMETDSEFWKMYDFRFISGKPYDAAAVRDGQKVAVLSRSVARGIFGKEDVAGEVVNINSVPYVVSGVVEDVSPIMKATFSNIYVPFSREKLTYDDNFGNVMVHMLMQPGAEAEKIKEQVKARYSRLTNELKKNKEEAVYQGAPHDAEYLGKTSIFGNVAPDLTLRHGEAYITYIVLMLLPAINLSSMMRGRLRHRVSEIGVRRAFGAKRVSIISQIMCENFIITLIGGIIGLAVSYTFVYFAAEYFFNLTEADSTALEYASSSPAISMLFTWKNFIVALVACFVLNLLSAFIPAWRASRVEPAVAIVRGER